MTRRTRCWLIAKRARLLSPEERAKAWIALTSQTNVTLVITQDSVGTYHAVMTNRPPAP